MTAARGKRRCPICGRLWTSERHRKKYARSCKKQLDQRAYRRRWEELKAQGLDCVDGVTQALGQMGVPVTCIAMPGDKSLGHHWWAPTWMCKLLSRGEAMWAGNEYNQRQQHPLTHVEVKALIELAKKDATVTDVLKAVVTANGAIPKHLLERARREAV